MVPAEFVETMNALTLDLLGDVELDESTVLSGPSVWLLLAALQSGASGDARPELEVATGVSTEIAANTVESVLASIRSVSGVGGALALWVERSNDLLPSFVDALPSATIGPLPSRTSELDRWVNDHTDGLIDRFPAVVEPDTLMLAASVLMAKSEWAEPFWPAIGTWHDGRRYGWLERRSGLDSVALIDHEGTTISRAVCETVGGFDVHLVGGSPLVRPVEVLRTAMAALRGNAVVRGGKTLELGDEGGCLKVAMVRSGSQTPHATLRLPAFQLEAQHDLLAHAGRLGLVTASDTTRGHFAAMASEPLAVQNATQLAAAAFSAEGFRAAALAAVAIAAGAGLPPGEVKVASVRLDRPFGFVVIERSTNLALFAGWVAHPSVVMSDLVVPVIADSSP